MKDLAGACAVVALLFGLLYWSAERDVRDLEQARDSLKVVALNLESAVEAGRIRDREAARVAAEQRTADSLALARARGRVTTILDTATVLDSAGIRIVREAFDSLQAVTDSVLGNRDARIAQLESRVAFYRDTIIPQKDALVAQYQARLDEAIGRIPRRHGWKTDVALMAGAAGAAWLLDQ